MLKKKMECTIYIAKAMAPSFLNMETAGILMTPVNDRYRTCSCFGASMYYVEIFEMLQTVEQSIMVIKYCNVYETKLLTKSRYTAKLGSKYSHLQKANVNNSSIKMT